MLHLAVWGPRMQGPADTKAASLLNTNAVEACTIRNAGPVAEASKVTDLKPVHQNFGGVGRARPGSSHQHVVRVLQRQHDPQPKLAIPCAWHATVVTMLTGQERRLRCHARRQGALRICDAKDVQWHPRGTQAASKRHVASIQCSSAEVINHRSRLIQTGMTYCGNTAGNQSRTGCYTAAHVGVGALGIAGPNDVPCFDLQCWQPSSPLAKHSLDSTVSASLAKTCRLLWIHLLIALQVGHDTMTKEACCTECSRRLAQGWDCEPSQACTHLITGMAGSESWMQSPPDTRSTLRLAGRTGYCFCPPAWQRQAVYMARACIHMGRGIAALQRSANSMAQVQGGVIVRENMSSETG